MQAIDFGLAFALLVAMSFYLFRNYSMASRVWVSVASCLLFACMVCVSFAIRWCL